MPHHYTSRSLVHLEKSFPRDHETFGPLSISSARAAVPHHLTQKRTEFGGTEKCCFMFARGGCSNFVNLAQNICIFMTNFATLLPTHIFHHRISQRPEQALQ
jgi:hypothetical protein